MPSFGQNIPALKLRAIEQVNETIGKARMQYITVIPGQDMLYKAKQEEATECLEEGVGALAVNYPLLAAEIGITAPTLLDVAQVVVNMAFFWKATASNLEMLRLGTIQDLEGAVNRADIDVILSSFNVAVSPHFS
mgnify:CR=1 FL=1